jgi:RHS repeat-associated protein
MLAQEVIEPNRSAYRVTNNHQLAAFGNHTATTVSATGISPRSSANIYDSLGRFVIERRNAYNQVTSKITLWDAYGNALGVENIDGVLTTAAVDYMGRPFITYTETGAWQKVIQRAGAGSHCPVGDTAYHTFTTAGGQPSQYICHDVIRREIRSATRGFDGSFIYIDRFYDESGRPERVSEPYFAGNSRYWNRTAYDALGRVDAELAADGNDQTFDHDEAADGCIAGGPRQTLTINGLGQSRLELRNALGETTAVFDNNCGEVSYSYDAIGNPVSVIGADGAETSTTYDLAGRKTSLDDPDKGHWQYAYNALGELIRQLDSKSQALDFSYDLMGRVSERRELTGVSSLSDSNYTTVNRETDTWINSTSPGIRGKGQAATAIYRLGENGAIVHRRDFNYDGLGRPGIVSISMDGLQLSEETTYDEYGRVFQQFDASGDDHGIRYHFNAHGYLEKQREAREGANGRVYQQIQGMDARGNVVAMSLGNGVEAFASFQRASGRLEVLEAYDSQGVELQYVSYNFDAAGNLLSRHDRSRSKDLNESFAYDGLNRLEEVMLAVDGQAAQTTLRLQYNASGNITYKSDVGSYLYGQGATGPHAATSAGGVDYRYDANGNQLSSTKGRNITYSVFDKATRVEMGSEYTEFVYGIGNRRIKRSDDNAVDGARNSWYFSGLERIQQAGENVFFKRYLGDIAIASYYPATGQQEIRYLLKDHLGSIHTVVPESGLAADATGMSFGAFGQRRNADRYGPLSLTLQQLQNAATTHGFTGHEHADGLGIIHMNGRIYDPKLGRFLQADPFVQALKDSQSLNRFTYVRNNPLSYTDPSGYFGFKRFFKRWGRVIVAAVAGYFTFGAASSLAWSLMPSTAAGVATTAAYTASAVIGGAAAGFVAGGIISENLKGALTGAFTGAALAYIGAQVRIGIQNWRNGRGEVWHVKYDEFSQEFVSQHISDPTMAQIDQLFVNGQSNQLEKAMTLGFQQLGEPSEFFIFHNPTNGFIADTVESVLGKITNTSSISRQLSGLLESQANSLTNLTAHSQGGIIVSNALRRIPENSLTANTIVNFNGAAVGPNLYSNTVIRSGAIPGYYHAHAFDAVPNLFGMATFNPFKILGSVLMSPLLLTPLSPHTFYTP